MMQRYVSKELTHFVGRGLKTQETQFGLLMKIIESGELVPKHHYIEGYADPFPIHISIGNSEKEPDEIFTPRMVCFCDIPVGDLGIHMNKYSKFGLSFSKSFLIQQGANPVFYIANNSIIPYTGEKFARAKVFKDIVGNFRDIMDFLMVILPPFYALLKSDPQIGAKMRYGMPDSITPDGHIDSKKWAESLKREIIKLADYVPDDIMNYAELPNSIITWIFCFIKLFNIEKGDVHEENYYMEREWRIIGKVNFNINDIYRIVLPKSYIKKFRERIPHYMGQITFTDELE